MMKKTRRYLKESLAEANEHRDLTFIIAQISTGINRGHFLRLDTEKETMAATLISA